MMLHRNYYFIELLRSSLERGVVSSCPELRFAYSGLSTCMYFVHSLVADFGDPQKNVYAGGEYTLDPAFNGAPAEFVAFAEEMWEKYQSIQ